jgi:hypothetical protein
MRYCIVPNCTKQARSSRIWGVTSSLCEGHRRRWRRHGDAGQAAITRQELKPLAAAARRIIARDLSGRLQGVLARLHSSLQDFATGVLSDIEHGQRVPKWTLRGVEQVVKVMTATDPVECACVVSSVFMLCEEQPRRFASQRGFQFELVQAFRKQIDTSWGRYWDEKTNRSKTVYVEITPRCVEAIAAILIHTYAKLASRIITLYQQERTQPMKDKQTIDEVFDALTNPVDPSNSLTRRVSTEVTEDEKPQGWSKVTAHD